jgi:hypothetical protein
LYRDWHGRQGRATVAVTDQLTVVTQYIRNLQTGWHQRIDATPSRSLACELGKERELASSLVIWTSGCLLGKLGVHTDRAECAWGTAYCWHGAARRGRRSYGHPSGTAEPAAEARTRQAAKGVRSPGEFLAAVTQFAHHGPDHTTNPSEIHITGRRESTQLAIK